MSRTSPPPPPTRPAVPGRGSVRQISEQVPHELSESLSAQRRRAITDLIDSVLRSSALSLSSNDVLTQLCERLNGMGVPLDRYVSSTAVLTPEPRRFAPALDQARRGFGERLRQPARRRPELQPEPVLRGCRHAGLGGDMAARNARRAVRHRAGTEGRRLHPLRLHPVQALERNRRLDRAGDASR